MPTQICLTAKQEQNKSQKTKDVKQGGVKSQSKEYNKVRITIDLRSLISVLPVTPFKTQTETFKANDSSLKIHLPT